MGKSTISMAIFNSYVCLPEGNLSNNCYGYGSKVETQKPTMLWSNIVLGWKEPSHFRICKQYVS